MHGATARRKKKSYWIVQRTKVIAVDTNLSEPMAASLQTTADVPRTKRVFIPQETLRDHLCDVILVAKDGKELKSHRHVLSEASPFFNKLLNSDMKESNEGIIRLEMATALCLRDILEFIYTGSVQISAEDSAQDLIAMAEYLVLPHLKTLAESFLVNNFKLDASNSFSTYYFAERYGCEELMSVSKDVVLKNFTTVAKTEDFFNLSSTEVQMWISSDELNVSAEEDVFKIILGWINRSKFERQEHFAELFREVRLVYVSRDYLHSDVVTNDFVKKDEVCMNLVKEALSLIHFTDNNYCHKPSVPLRKSLESPVIVVGVKRMNNGKSILCYHPRENKWSRFPGGVSMPCDAEHVISCQGKLYFICPGPITKRVLCYDSFSDCWKGLPYKEEGLLRKLFVRNEEEIYALTQTSRLLWPVSSITRFRPDENFWEYISIVLSSRVQSCVVAKDNYVYFIGGKDLLESNMVRSEVARFDLRTNTWDEVADMQEPRTNACGAVVNEKVFVIGGVNANGQTLETSEVYEETTNEWHFIANLRPRRDITPVCADGKLYVLSNYINRQHRESRIVECYDAEKNAWIEKTELPLSTGQRHDYNLLCCSMRVFKGCALYQNAFPDKFDKPNCTIM